MSGALLVENKLHHEYWRRKSGQTSVVSTENTTYGSAEGYPFINCIDDSGATSFRVDSVLKKAYITITFPVATTINGFAIYGHNLTRNQGIKILYDTDTADSIDTDFVGTPYTSNTYKPADNLYSPFGAVFDASVSVRRLTIETVGWGENSYISILSMGHWLTDHVEISAPFVPPSFTPYKASIKRNNNANYLSSDVKKVPQKISIKLQHFSEADLYTTTDSAQYTKINGHTKTYPFIDYAGYFLSHYPFFFMYNKGTTGDDDATKQADQQKLYFCTIDGGLKQPSYSSPTLLNWSINAIGYIE